MAPVGPMGPVRAVGLLEAPPSGLEGPAETLLSPGSGGVLAGGLVPALVGGRHLPVESLERGPELADLLVE